MKLILTLLIAFSAFFAQDVNWKFQVRERSAFTNYNDVTKMGSLLRTRLSVKLTGEKKVSGFIQLQDSRGFGDNTAVQSFGATLQTTNRIDMHQAYINIDELFDTNFSLKIGRQEVAYSNQRLVGSVGWHNVARSFDGAVLSYKSDKNFVDLFSHTVVNNGLAEDSTSIMFRGLHGHFQMNKNLGVDAFFYNEVKISQDYNRQTAGVFAKGKMDKISYEVMLAKQMGEKSTTVDFDGMYLSALVGYSISKDTKVFGGYEMMSGDDATTLDKNESFAAFAGTNHKFNGFMDYFNVPGGRFWGNTAGLNDMMVRLKHKGLMVDFHMFTANEVASGVDDVFGNEIDVTYKHKYSKNLAIVSGLSMFMNGDDAYTNSADKGDMFAYTMFIFNL